MKKTAVIMGLALAVAGGFVGMASQFIAYPGYSVTVPVTSTMLAPPSVGYTNSWATNTAYSVGDRCFSTGVVFWCVSAGTSSTNAALYPRVTTTNDYTDAAVTWKAVRLRKKALFLQNMGSGDVALGFGSAAVAGDGIVLLNSGGSITFTDDDLPRCAVYGISITHTNTIRVQEW